MGRWLINGFWLVIGFCITAGFSHLLEYCEAQQSQAQQVDKADLVPWPKGGQNVVVCACPMQSCSTELLKRLDRIEAALARIEASGATCGKACPSSRPIGDDGIITLPSDWRPCCSAQRPPPSDGGVPCRTDCVDTQHVDQCHYDKHLHLEVCW